MPSSAAQLCCSMNKNWIFQNCASRSIHRVAVLSFEASLKEIHESVFIWLLIKKTQTSYLFLYSYLEFAHVTSAKVFFSLHYV